MSDKFVSIGMPVYNGGESMRRALDCLLAQTHSNFELIISDNASTDSLTKAITEDYAKRDSRIRLTRQPFNQGAVPNFIWVLHEAKGDYFMWAAHDDFWSSNYVEALANRLDQVPEAVLAAGSSQVATTRRNGATEQEIVPSAPNGDRDATLGVYIKHFMACVWVYGLYRTEWVANAAPEWKQYPLLSGDVIWLWGVLLQQRVVGDPAATFFYTADHRARKKLTYRQTVVMWGIVGFHLTRLSWQRLPANDRVKGVLKAWRYVYLHHLNRKNPITTTIRIAKLAVLWCWIGIETGFLQLMKNAGLLVVQGPRQPEEKPQLPDTSQCSAVNMGKRNAA